MILDGFVAYLKFKTLPWYSYFKFPINFFSYLVSTSSFSFNNFIISTFLGFKRHKSITRKVLFHKGFTLSFKKFLLLFFTLSIRAFNLFFNLILIKSFWIFVLFKVISQSLLFLFYKFLFVVQYFIIFI